MRTSGLLLRRWRQEDRAPFAVLNADPDVRRYLQGPIDRQGPDALVDASAHPPPVRHLPYRIDRRRWRRYRLHCAP
jgi:hypothetical protein